MFKEALTCKTDEQLSLAFLSVVEELTGCRFGFIGEINLAERYDTIMISNPGWDTCKFIKKLLDNYYNSTQIYTSVLIFPYYYYGN